MPQSFAVTQAAQTIAWVSPPAGSSQLPATDFAVSATATSGLTVAFTSTTLGVCTVTGTTVHPLALGTCTIRASQAGNAAFLPASPVDRSFTIAKGNQTITFGALADRTLAESPVTISATASSGLPVTFSSATLPVCSVTGTSVSLLTTGTCTIRADQPGDANWNPAPQVPQSFAVTQAAPGTVWYFAEGFTGMGWTTELHLLNPNAGAATVAVTYLLDSGSTVTRNVTIPGLSKMTLDASNLTVGPGPDVAFGASITSDIPIVAEEQMFAGASGDFAHSTTGSRALSTTWYFAEGFTQFGWETWVLVANPGTSAADVTITYQKQAGGTVTRTVTVGPGQRYTFAGHVDLPNEAFSVSVSSTQPIVSELAMYEPARAIAHRTVGVTGPAMTWYLGEGFTGFGWQTFISVGNPGAAAATVTATFNIDGGAPVVKELLVAAHSRGTFIAHETATGVGVDKAFGVYITSTAPVVVQEVLIDPAAGASRANSTMAAAALSSQWSFSGGSSNAGVVTFLTVSNPGGSAASVTATYYFHDGTAPVSQVLTIPAQSRGTFASNGGSPGVPANKSFGIVVTATGGLIVVQEAVYDEPLHRAFSAGGAPGQ